MEEILISAFGDFAKVVAAMIAAYQIFLLMKETRRKTDFDKRKATLDYITGVNERYSAMRVLLASYGGELPNTSRISQVDREVIISYLRIMERLSLGIQKNVYDQGLVEKMISTSFRRTFNKLKPYIDEVRVSDAKDDGTTNKKMWCETQWLYDSLNYKESPDVADSAN